MLLGIAIAAGRVPGVLVRLADVRLRGSSAARSSGAALGYGIAASIVRLRDRDLLIGALDGWVAVAATLLIYGAAETIGTYGFLAVFAGGLAFRRYERDHELNARVHDGAELVEKFGELAVILLLGSMLTLDGLGAPGVAGWGLALLVVFVAAAAHGQPRAARLAAPAPRRARVPRLVRRPRRRDALLRRRRERPRRATRAPSWS